MNVRGRDVLLTGFMKQQVEQSLRQLRNTLVGSDGTGGFDTIGLLLDSVGCQHLTYTREMLANEEAQKAHTKCQVKMAKSYDISGAEWVGIWHDNETLDWLTIGMKYCKEESVGGKEAEGGEETKAP